ncbi:MAG: 1,4-dihydroxy-6-naphthoate synthase [Sphingobacteriales bacterium]|nr:1,4-dihydroxy-6-naphthoate synthase [Sphingobacteriales bacterium]MBI3718841.1 1,4-dihydroxy-6-naphthoate synthase [Sphingobacteriales bacterium]
MSKKFTLGFSPCPNDTFIFDALVNKKIDAEGLDFEVVLEDVQTLNQWALEGKLDISKISYGVLPLLTKNYSLLNSGGALGNGVGPLLISKKNIAALHIDECTVAVPGENTTAYLLFSLAFPHAKKKQFIVFNKIEDAILSEKVDCGVIIHENRFTYQKRGLKKILDLGEYWEEQTGCPIPLGGIVIKKFIDKETALQIDKLIRQSIEYAFQHYPALTDYVKIHSQEMEEYVMRKHIELYVNDFSIDQGEKGRVAIEQLLSIYSEMNNITINTEEVFLTP